MNQSTQAALTSQVGEQYAQEHAHWLSNRFQRMMETKQKDWLQLYTEQFADLLRHSGDKFARSRIRKIKRVTSKGCVKELAPHLVTFQRLVKEHATQKLQEHIPELHKQVDREASARTKKPIAAIQPWGLSLDIGDMDDPIIGRVVNSLFKTGHNIEVLNCNVRSGGEAGPIEADMLRDVPTLRGKAIKKVILMVAKSSTQLLEYMGALEIAGIEIYLVQLEGFNVLPKPCTMRHRKAPVREEGTTQKWNMGIPTGELAVMAGQWSKIDKGVFKWQKPRWSYDELANTTFQFGKVIMWTVRDYMNIMPNGQKIWAIETKDPKTGKYVPLVPPKDVPYPHMFDLVGFKFSEIPARYFDYLVGQSWLYGEFGQKVRAWHAHPVIQAELSKYEDKDLETQLDSDSNGYWDHHDQYISTGCQNGKEQKAVPVWLTPRDRFGKPMEDKAKEDKILQDRYARTIEKLMFNDGEDSPPINWHFVKPWGFESLSREPAQTESGQHLDQVQQEDLQDEEERIGNYSLLEEEDTSLNMEFTKAHAEGVLDSIKMGFVTGRFYKASQIIVPMSEHAYYLKLLQSLEQRRGGEEATREEASRTAKWIYNPEIHIEKMIEKAKAKATVAGLKARASGDEERIFDAIQGYKDARKEKPWQREQAEKKAETHAWYMAGDLLDAMERIQEQARAIKVSGEGTPWELFRKLEDVGIQITPMLKESIGVKRINEQTKVKADKTMVDLLREEYLATKKLLKEMGIQLRRDPRVEALGEVLETNPELVKMVFQMDMELLEEVLPEFPTIELPDDFEEMKKEHLKEKALMYPELYTKKGTRRVRPAHERKTRKQKKQ